MNRLDTERLRLFGTDTPTPDGRLRAAAIDIHQRAGWEAVGAIWQGVQDELELPPPAVAINGVDGFQLWFSLAEPVAADTLLGWLDALRRRYAATSPAARFKLIPSAETADRTVSADMPVPPLLCGAGSWSAFVAPGLAPMFTDEPWLDLAPSADAQADLLQPLRSIGPADWARALQRVVEPAPVSPASPAALVSTTAAASATGAGEPTAAHLPSTADPRQFLLAVMNDPAVALALRIDAAKALLPHT